MTFACDSVSCCSWVSRRGSTCTWPADTCTLILEALPPKITNDVCSHYLKDVLLCIFTHHPSAVQPRMKACMYPRGLLGQASILQPAISMPAACRTRSRAHAQEKHVLPQAAMWQQHPSSSHSCPRNANQNHALMMPTCAAAVSRASSFTPTAAYDHSKSASMPTLKRGRLLRAAGAASASICSTSGDKLVGEALATSGRTPYRWQWHWQHTSIPASTTEPLCTDTLPDT